MESKETYKYPIALTQQFRFCGNPFRLDFYKGCDFGCNYCFANCRGGNISHEFQHAKFEIIENYFKKAFENNKETKNITVELLRNYIPLHIGGMSDPFQTREWELELNYRMIELSNKYNYPLIFSTKTDYLPNKYYDILNPEIHAFQISIMGYDDDFIKKYEINTKTAKERIDFIKKLRNKGFWCSVRLQPLIDIEQAIKLCKNIDGIASYLTIEHLKIPTDNTYVKNLFLEIFDKDKYYKPSRSYELKKEYKKENIEKILSIMKKTTVGIGDNDLHYMSQSRCCCGIDTIGKNFDNYLKYNQPYFVTAKNMEDLRKDSFYIPENNVSSCFNSEARLIKTTDFKTYTNYYCNKKCDEIFEDGDIKDYFKSLNFDSYEKNKMK